MALVLIEQQAEGPVYAIYEGRERRVAIQTPGPMTPEQVEEFRKDPEGFINS